MPDAGAVEVPDLWSYACALYGAEGVSERLIEAQDAHGLDVNLLLSACWLGAARNRALSTEDARRLDAAIAGWRAAVTQPLRAVRRELSADSPFGAEPGAAPLRRMVLAAEIESEKVTLQRIEALIASEVPAAEATTDDPVAANLLACAEAGGASLGGPWIDQLVEHMVVAARAALASANAVGTDEP